MLRRRYGVWVGTLSCALIWLAGCWHNKNNASPQGKTKATPRKTSVREKLVLRAVPLRRAARAPARRTAKQNSLQALLARATKAKPMPRERECRYNFRIFGMT